MTPHPPAYGCIYIHPYETSSSYIWRSHGPEMSYVSDSIAICIYTYMTPAYGCIYIHPYDSSSSCIWVYLYTPIWLLILLHMGVSIYTYMTPHLPAYGCIHIHLYDTSSFCIWLYLYTPICHLILLQLSPPHMTPQGHDSFICVTWLIHTKEDATSSCSSSFVWMGHVPHMNES